MERIMQIEPIEPDDPLFDQTEYRLNLKNYPKPLVMSSVISTDPTYPAGQISLVFTEEGAGGAAEHEDIDDIVFKADRSDGDDEGRPFEFLVVLDSSSFKPLDTPKYKVPEAAKGILDEVLAQMPKDVKERLRSLTKEADKHRDTLFGYLKNALLDSKVVLYLHVFDLKGGVMTGWKNAQIEFEHEGGRYQVETAHCINPSCGCTGAVVIFHMADDGKGNEKDLFMGTMTDDSKLHAVDAYGCTVKEAQQIFSAWMRTGADVPALVASRHEELHDVARHVMVKAFGRGAGYRPSRYRCPIKFRLQQEADAADRDTKAKGRAASVARPASRSDPCPCGSGKKYKRCCGNK